MQPSYWPGWPTSQPSGPLLSSFPVPLEPGHPDIEQDPPDNQPIRLPDTHPVIKV